MVTSLGAPVTMAHANNCTSDLNAWVEVFSQFAEAIGAPVERGRLFDVLLGAAAEGNMDEAGVISHNFLSGDALVHLPAGRPLTMRRPGAALTLAGLMRINQHINPAAAMLTFIEATGTKELDQHAA